MKSIDQDEYDNDNINQENGSILVTKSYENESDGATLQSENAYIVNENHDHEMEELDLKDNDIDENKNHSSKSSFFILNYIQSLPKEILYTVHLSIGFLFIFLGFSPTQNLISNIHPKDGVIGLGLLYLFFAIGCFVSPILCKKIGLIKSLFLAGLTYSIFIFCATDKLRLFYFPASILIGVGAAILWTSQPTYLSRCSKNEKELGKYSGIFNSIYTCGGITGNFLSGLLTSNNISITLILILFGSATALGCIIVGFVKSIPSKVHEPVVSVNQTLKNIFSCFKLRPIQILIPTLVLQGQSQGYFFSTIPYLVGLKQTGYVMMVFGVVAVLGCVIWGPVHDKIGKKTMVYSMMALLPLSFLLAALGRSHSDTTVYFYFSSGFNGLFDSCQTIYIFAIISTIYPNDNIAQYSVTRFVMSISTAVSFFTFHYLPFYLILGWHIFLLIISTCSQIYLLSQISKNIDTGNDSHSNSNSNNSTINNNNNFEKLSSKADEEEDI